METNKLKEEIGNLINDASCDWQSDSGFKPIDNAILTDKIYSLISDVSVSFLKWYDFNDYKKLAALLGKPSFDYNDLLDYFIKNIYNQS